MRISRRVCSRQHCGSRARIPDRREAVRRPKTASRAGLWWLLAALAITRNPGNTTVAAADGPALAPIATAFTYQGRLDLGGSPANGVFDLRFTLYNAATSGDTAAGPLTNSAVSISNGLFAVALDFGAVFDGTARWFQVDARATGGGAFASLAPRQAITAVPYALAANTAASLVGALPAAQLSGTLALGQLPATLLTNGQASVSLTGAFRGNAAALTNLNASALASGTVPLARLPDQGFALPQMFGAVGDGVTDDTAALQAWINYCTSNHLEARLPAARVCYAISKWLMITNAVTMRGPGEAIEFPDVNPPARAHIRQTSPAAGVFLIQGNPYYAPPPDGTRFEQVFCSASAFNTNAAFEFDGTPAATDNARIISCGASNFLYGVLNASACVLRVESCSFNGVGWGFYQGPGRYFTSTNDANLNVNEVANTTLGGFSNCVWLAGGILTLDNCDIGGTLTGPAILQTGGLLYLNNINLENDANSPAIVSLNNESLQLRGGRIVRLGPYSTNAYSLFLSNGWAIIDGASLDPNSEGFQITEANPESQILSVGPYRERLLVGPLVCTNFTGAFLTTLSSFGGWPVLGGRAGPLASTYGIAPTLIFGQRIGGLNQTAIYAPVGMEQYTHDSATVFVDLLQYQKDLASGLAASYAAAASTVTNGGNGAFTGVFTGNGAGLTNLPSSATGLFACRHTPVGITNSVLPAPVYSALIPANAIGKNGVLRASCLLSASGSTGIEVRYYYGTTLVASFAGPAGYSSLFGMREIANRNAANSQISLPAALPPAYGSATQAPPICRAFDTSTNFTFSVVLSPSGGAQTNTLEAVDVEILHRD